MNEHFTPGPWEVVKKKELDYSNASYEHEGWPDVGYSYSVRINENTIVSFDNNEESTLDKSDPFPFFNNESDADLIAAAPELFQALKEIVEKWDSFKGMFEHYYLVKAVGALNKATGKKAN